MYQRLVMAAKSIGLSAANAEKESDDETHDLICNEKEYRGDGDHDEHHGGGNGRLAPRRPSDLLGFGAHLLQKLERVDFRHDSCRCLERRGPQPSIYYMSGPMQPAKPGRSGGTRTPNPPFLRPGLYPLTSTPPETHFGAPPHHT